MMHIAAYGRLGQDPREITTKSGKSMAAASIAVTLTDRQGEEHTQWLGLVAFGRVADLLLKHAKGELLSVSGRVQANVYEGRVELQVIADSILSARTARPSGGKRKGQADATAANGQQPAGAGGAPFDDEIPF